MLTTSDSSVRRSGENEVDQSWTLSAAGRAWTAGLCASMAQIHNPSISRLPLAIPAVADLTGPRSNSRGNACSDAVVLLEPPSARYFLVGVGLGCFGGTTLGIGTTNRVAGSVRPDSLITGCLPELPLLF